jgi:site-specific recombinase XerD
MLINECFSEYLNHINVTMSDGTYRFNSSHIITIVTDLQHLNIKRVNDITKKTLYDLHDVWKSRNVTESTIDKRFGIIKRTLRYVGINRRGVTDFPPIRFKRKGIKIVPHEDLLKLIHYFHDQQETPKGITRYLIFFMLFYTGVRVNELVHIEINNIDMETGSIILDMTKTGKSRMVFYDMSMNERLSQYISLDPKRKYLFWNYRTNRPYSVQNTEALLRYACKKLRIRRESPHKFRHTFATMMIDNGCPLIGLQLLLGHSRPEQTEQYLHLGNSFLKKHFDQFKPKI